MSDSSRKRKLVKPHEAVSVLLDVGSNSAQQLCDENCDDLSASLQLLDWIFSRKIFTESEDEFSLIFFGHESTRNELLPDYSNIYVHNDEYDNANIDWLRLLENEIFPNPICSGDFISALFVGLESLRLQAEVCTPKSLSAKTVMIISNFAGVNDESCLSEYLTPLITGFKALNVQLVAVGPDFASSPKNESQRIGCEFMKTLLYEINGIALSFRESLSQLRFFVPKQTMPRGQPFNWKIAKDFSINLKMYLKNTETSMKFSFNPVANAISKEGQQVQLKKRRLYETSGKNDGEGQIRLADLDNISDEAFQGSSLLNGKTIDRNNIIKGYRYGQSLIPFGMAEQSILEYLKEGKQLELLQFTKIQNILPQFLLCNCRYFLADAKDEASLGALLSLVKAMLELGVVALCRYAYNINSNPRIACLIPKISKKSNIPVLIHYTMPFNEDLRNYEFPRLEQLGVKPTGYQLDVVDEYVNSLLLFDPSSTFERMRCRNILNPKHQYQCQLLRQRALLPNEPFPEIFRERLLEGVSPPKELLNTQIIESINDSFSLEKNPYTRIAAFSFSARNRFTAESAAPVEQPSEKSKEENVKSELDSKFSGF